jgi:hypothetical protein
MRLSLIEGIVLFVLFVGQLLFPIPEVRYAFAFFYLAAALFILLRDKSRIRAIGLMLRSTAQQLFHRNNQKDK